MLAPPREEACAKWGRRPVGPGAGRGLGRGTPPNVVSCTHEGEKRKEEDERIERKEVKGEGKSVKTREKGKQRDTATLT